MSFLKDLIESAFPVAYAEEVCIAILTISEHIELAR